jgi:hypothetical protein
MVMNNSSTPGFIAETSVKESMEQYATFFVMKIKENIYPALRPSCESCFDICSTNPRPLSCARKCIELGYC